MRTLHPRLHRPGDPFHLSMESALWTAGGLLAALVTILVLFFWVFATRAY